MLLQEKVLITQESPESVGQSSIQSEAFEHKKGR
jgi:hypothetical protein